MKMTPEQFREIFARAMEKKSLAERERYLTEACQGEPELRQEVESLLRAQEQAGEFLGQTVKLPPSNFVAEKPGDKIGRYKLLQQIGAGGCGVVYMADQEEPVKRRVALKVIKPGMDTKEVLGRFEAERQALALMDHPNIAKVLDAGTTETGRPYFVMELVRGLKITQYCDETKLPIRARLDLFILVCHAVQHAHQKGIIHRDLKPSNILVTVNDGVPVPKVIDFGIAKATNGRQLTDKMVYTAFEQFIGTPAYMSPEQAVLTSLDIDTRSDIYSLGVLLYELLTGCTPFDAEELMKIGFDEMRRTIREKEPARPSTRLGTLPDKEISTTALRRGLDVPKLVSQLRGDLDWIVMKCLEKDRARRYDTANGLAMDIERHIQNEPVIACPPSAAYRFQKFARRNKAAFLSGAAVIASLVIGLGISLRMFVKEKEDHGRAVAAEKQAEAALAGEAQSRQEAEDNARQALASEQHANLLAYVSDMRLASEAWEDGNLSLMINLLNTHRPKRGGPDLRGFEWYCLQELAKGQQQCVLHGHTNAVLAVAFSPDGKWLASRSQTDTRLWDEARQSLAAAWPSSSPPASPLGGAVGISFSYDSRYLLLEMDGGLELANIATGQSRLLHTGETSRPSLSPVTNLMAFNAGSRIVIWDYLADKEVVAATNGGSVLSWSPDGSRLLTIEESSLCWWDVATMKCVYTNGSIGELVGSSAVLSPDGKKIAVADFFGQVRLMEADKTNVMATFDSGATLSVGSTSYAPAPAISPDGQILATSSRNQAILLWKISTGQQAAQLRGQRGKILALAFSPDGKLLASGGKEGDVMLWNPAVQSGVAQILNLTTGNIQIPRFSPDAKRIGLSSGAVNGGSSILDSSSLQTNSSCTGQIVSFSPDGHQFVTFVNGSAPRLEVWEIGAVSNRATISLNWTNPAFLLVLFPELSPDGTIIAADVLTQGAKVELFGTQLFDAATGGKLLFVTNSVFGPGCCFLRDGHTCVFGEFKDSRPGSKIKLFDIQTHQVRELDCHQPLIRGALSPDGKLLAASRLDNSILLWNLDSQTELGTLSGHQGQVMALAFTPDSLALASGSLDQTIKLWNLATLREVASFSQRQVSVGPVLAFSPDNQLLVYGEYGFNQVLRAPRGDAPVQWSAPALSPADLPTNSIWRIPDGSRPLPQSHEAILR